MQRVTIRRAISGGMLAAALTISSLVGGASTAFAAPETANTTFQAAARPAPKRIASWTVMGYHVAYYRSVCAQQYKGTSKVSIAGHHFWRVECWN